MAKKKKKSPASRTGGAIPLSPARFLREKARSLPTGDCFISPDDGSHSRIAVITRRRGSGNIAFTSFLIDTACLGIKDIDVRVNMSPAEYEKHIALMKDNLGIGKVSYPEIHNFILTALDFAEEGGLSPIPEWNLAQFMLDEDTDDIPMIEYEFGIDGNHVLFNGAYEISPETIATLREHLGDKFVNLTGADEGEPYSDWYMREYDRHPHESFVEPGELPAPPSLESLRHPEIIAELGESSDIPSKTLVDHIKSLVDDGIVADLATAILNEIAVTRYDFDNMDYRPLLFNCMFVLIDIADAQAIPALEQLCLFHNETFLEYHFGDVPFEILPTVLGRAYTTDPSRLAALSRRKGLDPYVRSAIFEGLALISQFDPAKEDEIKALFRQWLAEAPERVKNLDALDAAGAGSLLSAAMEANIDDEDFETGRQLFNLDLVDLSFIQPDDFHRQERFINYRTTDSLRSSLESGLEIE